MDGDFLSQEEVDALLKGVTSETDDPDDWADMMAGQTVQRMPMLEYVNERFARLLRDEIFEQLDFRPPEISVGPPRVQKCSEFIRNLVIPTNINIVEFSSLNGRGWVIFDPSLVFLCVDNAFGGEGRFHTRVEGRSFTPTEHLVIDKLLAVVLEVFAKCFSQFHSVELTQHGREMNTQYAGVADPSDIVCSTTFTLEFSGATADMHIMIPVKTLDEVGPKLYSRVLAAAK
jgi:flagellar motor switch protein FliM